jgi:hypothetical protein
MGTVGLRVGGFKATITLVVVSRIAEGPPQLCTPAHPLVAGGRYSAADYRDRLYKEIARKKKESRVRRSHK